MATDSHTAGAGDPNGGGRPADNVDPTVIDAFRGIPCESDDGDLAGWIEWNFTGDPLMPHIPFTRAEVEAIAERINTLSEIVAQNAMTTLEATAETQAMAESWTPPPQPDPGTLSPERQAQLDAARARAQAKKGDPIL